MTQVGPTLETLRDLADVVWVVPERHNHLRIPPCKALHEVDEGKKYRGLTNWDDPVEQVHQHGGAIVAVVCDYASCFANMFTLDHQSIYGHRVVARCLLEAATVAQWLNQPNITTEERVKRAACERLYSAYELKRLGMSDDDPDQRIAEQEAIVTGLGWRFSNNERDGKPKIGDTRRPSVEKSMSALFSDRKASEIGHGLWCTYSAISHSTWYGVRQGFIEQPGEPDAVGRSLAGMGVNSLEILSETWLMLIAVRRVAEARFELMGWDDDYWKQQRDRFEMHTIQIGLGIAKARGLD
jgi:hypothetical protein